MQISLTIFDLIVLLGVIQGLLISFILVLNPIEEKSKIFYSCILLILALLSSKILLHTLGLWNLSAFRYFPLAVDTTLQPLIYLYILFITTTEFKKKRIAVHFIPTIIFMLYSIIIYIIVLTQKDFAVKDKIANQFLFNQIKEFEDGVAVISAIVYWIFGYRRIMRYRLWLFSSQSDSRLQEFTWLKNMLLISGILVLAFIIIVVLEDVLNTGRHYFFHLQIFYIYLALITYYLSFKAYQLYGLSKPLSSFNTAKQLQGLIDIETKEIIQPSAQIERRTVENFDLITASIVKALENERIYLNAELSIKQLAQHIGCPVGVVSAVINKSFLMNFRSLINTYRVQEVKKLLQNPPSHLSMLGIALECGFNSEASFYRIFRQETGVSPNNYLHNPNE